MMFPSAVDMLVASITDLERDADRLVILHVDLRRKGELTLAQMLLQFLEERQNVALHCALAVLDIVAALLNVQRLSRISARSTTAASVFAVNLSASSLAFILNFSRTMPVLISLGSTRQTRFSTDGMSVPQPM